MRIFIHAGMHKTGTTSIQTILGGETARLAKHGYRAFVNPVQANAKNDKKFDGNWLKTQLLAAGNDGIDTLIISAEMISTFTGEKIKKLANIFSDCEVIFILSLRHWAHFLPSRWATNCLRRDTQSFPAYFDALTMHQDSHPEVAFSHIVRNISEAGSNDLRIISYDNAVSGKGLIPAFFTAIGLPEDFGTHGHAQTHCNKRLNHMETELVRLFNGAYALQHGHHPNELFWGKLNGTGLAHKYDFKPKIMAYLDENPEQKTHVSDIIKGRNIRVDLTPSNPDLRRWEYELENAASPFLVNPVNGKLFSMMPGQHFTCSDIETRDLPSSLQRDMLKAWER